MQEGMFALLKYTLFWIMLLISKLAFSCYVEKTELVPSTPLDSTASNTTRQVVSKTTSLSPRTPSVTNGSKGRFSTSSVDRSSGLSGRRKVGAPESRDSCFIMLPQVEIKTGDDVKLDLRRHRFEVSILVG
ncbi:187-kDa microtubule-associated protein AIR9 [Camellia lanceoleosa]|uniref:187-kDa microtubule-associated protein AIR9 n=1 Tax=Camellia lanceoleosa TaxID=1840588 RepID=A0ACC0HGA4_9ERIC|nr:187-kDa microtubule-associated protein AIR9 [Camellia lanceoleosa]